MTPEVSRLNALPQRSHEPRGGRPSELRRAAKRPLTRSDVQFAWANTDASLAAWRTVLAEWAAQHTDRGYAIRVGNTLLDYLQAFPAVTRRPQEFCSRNYSNPHPLIDWLDRGWATAAEMANVTHAFFAWYLDRHLTLPDDYGRPVLAPGYWNPMVRQRRESRGAKTARDALPTRLIRELLNVLQEDDWSWARARQADYISTVDRNTGERTRVWCPVRASALALKLLLPLRTFQVRMLESGEGDSEVFADGAWRANTGPHAPATGSPVRRGFLRAFRDRATASVTTGFYVNTNKTADLKQKSESGYEIPWQHEAVIDIVERLVRWQSEYNPVAEPLPWSTLHDKNVRLASVLRGPPAFFLMRDPNGVYANEPVSDGTLRSLWHALVAETERRMNVRRERMADGSPMRLTERVRCKDGRVKRRSIYDLHSLRVSLLTALATDGGVPLHILSQCIAGHASILMTLYYVKSDPVAMTQMLTEATAKIDHESQARFARYLRSEARSDDGFVINDPAGAAALDGTAAASWLQLDTGICPVGGTRCAEGGPAIAKNKHGPVPGGPRNCVQCRFHVTGPAFLGALVARFNATSLRLDAARRHCDAAQVQLTEAKERRFTAEKRGVFGDGGVSQAHERLVRAESQIQAHAGALQAVADLVERCKAVAAGSAGEGLNLVLAGTARDFTTAVRLTSDFALLDAVCQAATIHPCEEASEATLRRSQALDRFLVQHGHAPTFMHLSESEALVVGNEMMRLMKACVGRGRAIELVSEPTALLEAKVARRVQAVVAALDERRGAALESASDDQRDTVEEGGS